MHIMNCFKYFFSGFRRCCCPCCVKRGAREYLRKLEGTYPVTQQLLEDVENFGMLDCIKYLHIMQRDNLHVMWIPSICARILIIYYEDPDSVELYLPQICHLLLAFDEVKHSFNQCIHVTSFRTTFFGSEHVTQICFTHAAVFTAGGCRSPSLHPFAPFDSTCVLVSLRCGTTTIERFSNKRIICTLQPTIILHPCGRLETSVLSDGMLMCC